MREGWTYKKLGDVCKVVMGQSPDGNSVNDSNGMEFHQGKVFFGEKYLNESNFFTKQPSKIAEPNSVLLCVRAPVGIVNITPRKICIGRGLCAIQPNEKVLMPFLFFVLTQKQAYFDKNSTGSTFKAIPSKVVINTDIPIPPLSEQERIVSELDLLSSIIEKKKEQLKAYDQLAQSIFYDMFGDPIENPKGWEVKKLGEVCSKISDGVHAKPKYTESGMPFISVVNINKRYLDFDNCKFVSFEDGESINKRAKPQRNDVLYTKVGATYGIPALVDTDKDFCLYVSVCLIKPLHKIIDSVFLTNMMALPYVKHQADERIKGIGVPDLHLNQISAFNIIIPPLSLQQSFAEKIEAIEKQKSLIQQSIVETQTMFDFTMDKYFG